MNETTWNRSVQNTLRVRVSDFHHLSLPSIQPPTTSNRLRRQTCYVDVHRRFTNVWPKIIHWLNAFLLSSHPIPFASLRGWLQIMFSSTFKVRYQSYQDRPEHHHHHLHHYGMTVNQTEPIQHQRCDMKSLKCLFSKTPNHAKYCLKHDLKSCQWKWRQSSFLVLNERITQ